MADARTRMSMLIAEHPKLPKREQWRERTYTQNAGGYGGGANAKPKGSVTGVKQNMAMRMKSAMACIATESRSSRAGG